MPHAVFEPAPPLEHFWRVFSPFKEVRPDRTIIEAFAFEVGPPQHFFVICDQRGSRVTVRCAPLVPVSRSDGVLEIVRRIAVQFREAGGTLLRTNLDLDALPAPALEGGGE